MNGIIKNYMKKSELKKVEPVPVIDESQSRLQEFAQKLRELQESYQVNLYPANQVQENGEVQCMIKIIDIKK